MTQDAMRVWKPILGWLPRFICVHGEKAKHFSFSARWRRMNTSYHNDKSNWCCSCNSCFVEIENYWREMWDEYWRGRI